MSFLTSFLRIITFGLFKEPKKKDERTDYYEDQKDTHWWWEKDKILVYVQEMEFGKGINPYAPILKEKGIDVLYTAHRDKADIVIVRGNEIEKGGVTVRVPDRSNPRVIAWVKIVIAGREPEKGKRLTAVCLHEGGHGFGLTHDGAGDRNVMHPTATVSELDTQTANTLRRIYEERNNDRATAR